MKNLNRKKHIGFKNSTFDKLYATPFANIYHVNPEGRYPVFVTTFIREGLPYGRRFNEGSNYERALLDAIKLRNDLLESLPSIRAAKKVESNTGYLNLSLQRIVTNAFKGYGLLARVRNEENEIISKPFYATSKQQIPFLINDAVKWQKKNDHEPKLFMKYNAKSKMPFFLKHKIYR